MGLLEQLGVRLPVVQAGMGGGLSGHRLAAAVSAAGGLGTIGILAPDELRHEIAAVRALTDRPVAVNLLLPFARQAHFDAASEADVLVTFWGRPRRRASNTWIHQCGSLEEALQARAAGADAVIAQGVEAGGHVRGRRRRRCEARETLLTQLFGVGWPASHRVVANAATARWLRRGPRGPAWLRAFQSASAPILSRAPIPMQIRLAATQTPGRPLFGPAAATADGPPNLVDAGPLYAGSCIERINDIRSADELVRELAGGAGS